MLNIRPATPADRWTVIACALHRQPRPDVLKVDQVFDVTVAAGTLWVAMAGSRCVGFLAGIAQPHLWEPVEVFHVIAWFVVPEWRTSWAAGGLLRKMLRWCSTNHHEIIIMAAPIGSGLGKVIERAGFSPAETIHYLRRHACTADHARLEGGEARHDARELAPDAAGGGERRG